MTMNRSRLVILVMFAMPAAACAELDRDSETASSSADLESEGVSAGIIASSGTGGCTGASPISSCISHQGNFVLPDFYLNVQPDSTRYWYVLEVTRSNIGTWWSPTTKRIDHKGHYAAENVPSAAEPNPRGCAVNNVHVYTQDFVPHGVYPSPSVCY